MKRHELNARTIVRFLVPLLFLLGIAGYIVYQTRLYRAGPVIVVYEPSPGAVLTDPLVTIEGRAENVAFLSLNDEQIFIDENNIFSEKLLVPPGYTIMEIEARDRFGREKTVYLEVVFDENRRSE